jgi:hypothetical protein
VGLYSWTVAYIYANRVHLIEPSELGTYLRVGPIDLGEHPPYNVRRLDEWTDDSLYTDELRELVWARDGVAAAKMGYTFDR